MRLDTIVVGVDFGDPSTAAVRWVAESLAPGARLVLVHVLEPAAAPGFLRAALPATDDAEARSREEAARRLGELASAVGASDVVCEVVSGRPPRALATAAAEHGADLIVVGPHGRKRALWHVLGSTAEHLLAESPVPVLLARRLPPGPPTRILVPIDASACSAAVLRCTRALIDRTGAEVALMHVLDPALIGRVRMVSADRAAERFEEEARSSALQWLRDRAAEISLPPDRTARVVVVGDAASEIVHAATRDDADLVVMGSRGLGAVNQALIGSTARSVLRGAPCPVLVVLDRQE